MKKLPRIMGKPSGKIAFNLFRGSWPILLLVPLILFGLEAIIAFPVTLIILAIQQRTKWAELNKALVYGLDPKILFLLYAIMLYKTIVESSGTAMALFSDMQAIGIPALFILFALPFLIGFATGFSMAFVGVTFPLLAPYMTLDAGANNYALLLTYTSGLVGVLMSPLHLCLVMSAEYFKANLARMYKYISPPLLGLVAIAILIYCITA